jgi:hypothetical protein
MPAPLPEPYECVNVTLYERQLRTLRRAARQRGLPLSGLLRWLLDTRVLGPAGTVPEAGYIGVHEPPPPLKKSMG